MSGFENNFDRRKRRVRFAIKSKSNGKLRLSIHRSGKHIYAQIIDDKNAVTLVSASTLDKDFANKETCNVESANGVGQLLAKRSLEKGISNVVFDRGGFLFHGRVKALAEGARSAGLSF